MTPTNQEGESPAPMDNYADREKSLDRHNFK